MKEINLTNSTEKVKIDDIYYDRVKLYRWNLIGYYNSEGAIRRVERPKVPLANFITQNFDVMYDHKDRNIFNSLISNLRIATRSQNGANRTKPERVKECTSIYKGVSYFKRDKNWLAKITVNRKQIYLGYFNSEIDAAKAYNNAAVKYFGDFACINEL